MPRSSDELLALLDIEDIDTNLFRGRQPDTGMQRVFGGQVAAQEYIPGAPGRLQESDPGLRRVGWRDRLGRLAATAGEESEGGKDREPARHGAMVVKC